MKLFTTILIFVLICSVINTWALKDDKALVLYLPFDEGNGDTAMDASESNLEATLNGATWSTDGKIDGCIHLETTEHYVEIEDVDELDITGEITIQTWFFPKQSQGDSNLMGRRTSENKGGYVLQWSAEFTGTPQIETWIDIAGYKGTRNKQTIKPELEEWHHVASTYDGEKVRQYIDGELDVEIDAPAGNITSVDAVFRIGKSQTPLGGAIGYVDEVAIYNRALSDDEIKQDMNQGVLFDVTPNGKLATTWAKGV